MGLFFWQRLQELENLGIGIGAISQLVKGSPESLRGRLAGLRSIMTWNLSPSAAMADRSFTGALEVKLESGNRDN